jgi:hypothetical protein
VSPSWLHARDELHEEHARHDLGGLEHEGEGRDGEQRESETGEAAQPSRGVASGPVRD